MITRSRYWASKEQVKIEHHDDDDDNRSKSKKITKKNIVVAKVEQTESNDNRKVKLENKKSKKNLNIDDYNLPENWQTMYDNIVAMRSETLADVDTMGCHRCADPSDEITEIDRRFHALVALMLSSQTKDTITFPVMAKLKRLPLTVQTIESIDIDELRRLIRPVSFYSRKAQYIKSTARILRERYGGDIPRTPDELMKLPGVGPKMTHLAMLVAWNTITGIAVDTHVYRVCHRMRWISPSAKTPEQARAQLEARIPREYWRDINQQLVGFGQTICRATKPKCGECRNVSICPSAQKYSF